VNEKIDERPVHNDRVQVRYVLPSAINCFFHVYEEPLGRYGLRVLRHVLMFPGSHRAAILRTGCKQIVGPYDYVTVTYSDLVTDHTWCRTCAAAVAAESNRRANNRAPEEYVRPLTKEVL